MSLVFRCESWAGFVQQRLATTVRAPARSAAGDSARRSFAADDPSRHRVAGIAFVSTAAGSLIRPSCAMAGPDGPSAGPSAMIGDPRRPPRAAASGERTCHPKRREDGWVCGSTRRCVPANTSARVGGRGVRPATGRRTTRSRRWRLGEMVGPRAGRGWLDTSARRSARPNCAPAAFCASPPRPRRAAPRGREGGEVPTADIVASAGGCGRGGDRLGRIGARTAVIVPGGPLGDGCDGSFRGKPRAEPPDPEVSCTRAGPMMPAGAWRRPYDSARPSPALGCRSPSIETAPPFQAAAPWMPSGSAGHRPPSSLARRAPMTRRSAQTTR